MTRYEKNIAQTIDGKEVTTYPWIEAFHDQWISLPKTITKNQTASQMKGGLDDDDRVRAAGAD